MKTYDESFIINKPRRRWLKRIGCGLLVPLILVLLFLVRAVPNWIWRHHELQQTLDEVLDDLDRTDPGWHLEEIEAAREQIPEQENSARAVLTAAKLLPKKWPEPDFHERLTHLPPAEQLAPKDLARLQQELRNLRPALDEARKLAKMPRGRHRIAYKRNVLNTLLEDQQLSRNVAQLLFHDALECAQRQDMKGALASCEAALNVARSLGDEPFAISQLVRTAEVVLACQAVERALAQGEPAAEDLVAFAHLLDSEDVFPDLLITTRGERAVDQELFDAIESGDVSVAELADQRPNWHERTFGFFYRENVRAEHPTMLELMNRWVAIAHLPMPEQADAEQQFDLDVRALPATAILTRLLLPHLTKMGEASRRKHAYLRCTVTAFAAERYRRDQGTWPETIDKFCPDYLPVLPTDPFDGEELRLRRIEDGIVIYSVGQDKVDNNGNIDREHPNVPGVDIGVRLWDVAKRRQPPRPKPHNDQHPR